MLQPRIPLSSANVTARPTSSSPRYALLLILLTSAATLSLAQQQDSPRLLSRSDNKSTTTQALANRITLDVQVRDAANRPVTNLAQKDFSVLDDAELREILAFSNDSSAQVGDIVLAIDAIGCNFEQVARTKQQIINLLTKGGAHLAHPVSIVWLVKSLSRAQIAAGRADATVRPLQDNDAYLQRIPMSRDGLALARALQRSQIAVSGSLAAQGAQGDSARVQLSLRALNMMASGEAEIPGRKLVIWISPGWPLATQPDKRAADQLFAFVVHTYTQLQQARITLYAVDPGGIGVIVRSDDREMGPELDYTSQMVVAYMQTNKTIHDLSADSVSPVRKELRTPAQITPADLSLRSLATRTGGRVLSFSNDTAAQIAECMAEADSFYSLTYQASPARNPNEYHSTEVLVDQKGLRVSTRTGYFAQP